MSLIKLSVTSKLDGIPSWSLPAIKSCPAAFKPDGTLVATCRGCYATTANYYFPAVIAVREYNMKDWKRRAWVTDMVAELRNYRFFRWFDSGDCYSVRLAEKILEVMLQTPWCRHWLPTRMHKVARVKKILERMNTLPNVNVRYSSDSVEGGFTPGLHGSTVIRSLKESPEGVEPCKAYLHGGRCSGCRNCWDKSIPVIGYVAHGTNMKKVIRLVAQKTLF